MQYKILDSRPINGPGGTYSIISCMEILGPESIYTLNENAGTYFCQLTVERKHIDSKTHSCRRDLIPTLSKCRH